MPGFPLSISGFPSGDEKVAGRLTAFQLPARFKMLIPESHPGPLNQDMWQWGQRICIFNMLLKTQTESWPLSFLSNQLKKNYMWTQIEYSDILGFGAEHHNAMKKVNKIRKTCLQDSTLIVIVTYFS